MVERQYELLRKERLKGLEEQKPKIEENGTAPAPEVPPAAPAPQSPSEEAPAQQHQEVRIYQSVFCAISFMISL